MDDRRSTTSSPAEPLYAGLRLSSDEYLSLPDDGFRYELVDGVVVMSPSPSFEHQDIAGEIERQIRNFLIDNPVGYVSHELDVSLGDRLVYNPDLVYVSAKRAGRRPSKLTMAPDVVVEVLSLRTERYDLTTKLADYEASGIAEYWVIDPRRQTMRFLRLGARGYTKVKHERTRFASKAISGFVLDLTALRRVMRGA